ncbi:MAG: tryptophan synthase subunit beta [Candidatus Nanohaloarchaea archaeon]
MSNDTMESERTEFGGRYVPELLVPVLEELRQEFEEARDSEKFNREFREHLENFAGRPTNLYYAENLSERYGADIYLKREDLLHGGAHKINNTLGQALLAKKMGKERLIAETGAGQHGIATAMAGAYFDMDVEIYMGRKDVERQRMNALRMKKCGAEVNPVTDGSETLKDAVTAALQDYVSSSDSTHYLIGSVVGPEPFPEMVRYFHSTIGEEARRQYMEAEGGTPDALVACVGGGSNAIGLFHAFMDDDVEFHGAEAGGQEDGAAAISNGEPGIFQGFKAHLLQDEHGNVEETESVSAGLDYPAVGPAHSRMEELGRAEYTPVSDEEALKAFTDLSETEGVIPALESAHAVALAEKLSESHDKIIVNLSGRGDKDMETIAEVEQVEFT